jgi:hypothetical protein
LPEDSTYILSGEKVKYPLIKGAIDLEILILKKKR